MKQLDDLKVHRDVLQYLVDLENQVQDLQKYAYMLHLLFMHVNEHMHPRMLFDALIGYHPIQHLENKRYRLLHGLVVSSYQNSKNMVVPSNLWLHLDGAPFRLSDGSEIAPRAFSGLAASAASSSIGEAKAAVEIWKEEGILVDIWDPDSAIVQTG